MFIDKIVLGLFFAIPWIFNPFWGNGNVASIFQVKIFLISILNICLLIYFNKLKNKYQNGFAFNVVQLCFVVFFIYLLLNTFFINPSAYFLRGFNGNMIFSFPELANYLVMLIILPNIFRLKRSLFTKVLEALFYGVAVVFIIQITTIFLTLESVRINTGINHIDFLEINTLGSLYTLLFTGLVAILFFFRKIMQEREKRFKIMDYIFYSIFAISTFAILNIIENFYALIFIISFFIAAFFFYFLYRNKKQILHITWKHELLFVGFIIIPLTVGLGAAVSVLTQDSLSLPNVRQNLELGVENTSHQNLQQTMLGTGINTTNYLPVDNDLSFLNYSMFFKFYNELGALGIFFLVLFFLILVYKLEFAKQRKWLFCVYIALGISFFLNEHSVIFFVILIIFASWQGVFIKQYNMDLLSNRSFGTRSLLSYSQYAGILFLLIVSVLFIVQVSYFQYRIEREQDFISQSEFIASRKELSSSYPYDLSLVKSLWNLEVNNYAGDISQLQEQQQNGETKEQEIELGDDFVILLQSLEHFITSNPMDIEARELLLTSKYTQYLASGKTERLALEVETIAHEILKFDWFNEQANFTLALITNDKKTFFVSLQYLRKAMNSYNDRILTLDTFPLSLYIYRNLEATLLEEIDLNTEALEVYIAMREINESTNSRVIQSYYMQEQIDDKISKLEGN